MDVQAKCHKKRQTLCVRTMWSRMCACIGTIYCWRRGTKPSEQYQVMASLLIQLLEETSRTHFLGALLHSTRGRRASFGTESTSHESSTAGFFMKVFSECALNLVGILCPGDTRPIAVFVYCHSCIVVIWSHGDAHARGWNSSPGLSALILELFARECDLNFPWQLGDGCAYMVYCRA